MKIDRRYGIDVLRIASMLGIVLLHILGAGGVLDNTTSGDINYFIAWSLEAFALCVVNIFAIVTGFLYGGKSKCQMKSEKIVRLLAIVFFYCIAIFVITKVFFPHLIVGGKMAAAALFPPILGRYWYITCYTFLFFLIPFINALLNVLSQKAARRLILFLFLTLSCMSTFGVADYFRIGNGYSPFWLMFCYLLGAYIKLYGVPLTCKRFWLFPLLFANLAVTVLAKYLLEMVTPSLTIQNVLLRYTSPFILCNALILFVLLKDIQLHNKAARHGVLWLSSAAFPVYIIHSHIIVYDNAITLTFSYMAELSAPVMVASILVGTLLIYLVCTILDTLRNAIFKLPPIERGIRVIGQYLDALFFPDDFFRG